MKVSNKNRQFEAPAFYHVFNRGVAKQPIFLDAQDKQKFLSLIDRYTENSEEEIRSDGLAYTRYDVQIATYCLMGNHFHMFIYQADDTHTISLFMKSLMTAYSMYFNLRHKRKGPVFEGMFQASHIVDDAHFKHLSRYIHLNPRTYRTYRWSSLSDYLGIRETPWLHQALVNDMTPRQYELFLEDYEDKKNILKQIKDDLDL
jgi:putative transposase